MDQNYRKNNHYGITALPEKVVLSYGKDINSVADPMISFQLSALYIKMLYKEFSNNIDLALQET